MRVVITGITGFLGGHLAEAFLQHGHHVTGIVRPQTRAPHLQTLGVTLATATLDDLPALRAACQGADIVIHAAAKVHTHGFWRDFAHTNISGTRHVLQAATEAGVKRLVQVSTVGVYGFPQGTDNPPFHEANDYGRIFRWNYYSRSKIQAEQLVRAAHQSGRITTTIIRPTWVYGARDSTTIERLATALRTHRFRWIGDGHNRLSLIYVTDVANAVVLAAATPQSAGQTYNIADDKTSPTQREFITRLCELLELPLPTNHIAYRTAYNIGFPGECLAHLTRYRICPPLTRLTALLFGGTRRFSSEKIRTTLGWQPHITFDQGIQQTAHWYLHRELSRQP